jgi:DegV family protein with EDD domain
MSLKILTDSSCDLPLHIIKDNSDIVDFIGIPVMIETEDCIDDLGDKFSHDFFYSKLEEGIIPKTSQINVQVFYDKFETYIKNEEEVIYIGLNSSLSGTYNNALLAKNMIQKNYSTNNISIVETYSASVGLGLVVIEVIKLVRKGFNKEQVLQWIEENKLKVNHWFGVDDLEHLKKGGRISPAVAMVGMALNVKPILTVTHEGALETYSKVRGRNKVIKFLYSKWYKNFPEKSDHTVVIGHANCIEDAEKIKELIMGESELKSENIIITKLSATIASHVGQGMIAIVFIGKEDREK